MTWQQSSSLLSFPYTPSVSTSRPFASIFFPLEPPPPGGPPLISLLFSSVLRSGALPPSSLAVSPSYRRTLRSGFSPQLRSHALFAKKSIHIGTRRRLRNLKEKSERMRVQPMVEKILSDMHFEAKYESTKFLRVSVGEVGPNAEGWAATLQGFRMGKGSVDKMGREKYKGKRGGNGSVQGSGREKRAAMEMER